MKYASNPSEHFLNGHHGATHMSGTILNSRLGTKEILSDAGQTLLGINTLPDEVLILIFELLSVQPRICLGLRQTCRRFQRCIDTSTRLQLAIKLKIWGYECLHTKKFEGSTSSSSVLKSLEAHLQSWEDLRWKEHRVEIPESCAYDLTQGYLVSISDVDFSGAAFPTVTIIRLPISSPNYQHETLVSPGPNDSTPRAYNLPPFLFSITDVCIDPSQDLLILEEVCVIRVSRRSTIVLEDKIVTLF